ncbi:ATP-binding protein [Clostridium novyi]
MRYEKSIILTTNINFNACDSVFYNIITNAVLYKVLQHAHVIPIRRNSYRLKYYFKYNN